MNKPTPNPQTGANTVNFVRTALPGFVGLCVLAATLACLEASKLMAFEKACIIIGTLFAALFLVEGWFSYRNKHGLIGRPKIRKFSFNRLGLKVTGWAVTVAIMATPYWLFPEYLTTFYDPFYQALSLTWPYLAGFFFICIVWEDLCVDDPLDPYLLLGQSVCFLEINPLREGSFKRHFLGWLVKIYFLPLMFKYLTDYCSATLNFGSLIHCYDSLYTLVFMADTAFVCVGYAFANPITNTQIRSTEPTMLGWAVTLICYQPFWSIVGGSYISYGSAWNAWVSTYNNYGFQLFWIVSIMASLTLYIWATVAFGSRFSNLTHRGILTCGPYAYLKHPAYVGKLISFFLISVPFIGPNWLAILRSMLLWGLLCGVYYLRAKTEERHLRSIGPEYALYESEVAANQRRLKSLICNAFTR